MFVDLCLTVPVRLSVLLPYLGYLMKPLVWRSSHLPSLSVRVSARSNCASTT